jgi:NAD(P)-dependent dehydrogenase (short-subunit alcohol dehydrogenase family)
MQLTDRTAVVTGAASGLGAALSEALLARGMRLVLADVDDEALAATADRLRADGGEVLAVPTDVTDYAAVAELAEKARHHFGSVHVLCNNAGVHLPTVPLWECTLDDWRWLLEVNLMGVVHGIRAFVPDMVDQEDESHVVNTASVSGVLPGRSIYGVTKHAVVAASEALQHSLVSRGARTRVSVLCPAGIRTRIHLSGERRPDRFATPGPVPPGWSVEAAGAALASESDPRDVAETVVEAVRARRFYVLPHPGQLDAVRARAGAIASGLV